MWRNELSGFNEGQFWSTGFLHTHRFTIHVSVHRSVSHKINDTIIPLNRINILFSFFLFSSHVIVIAAMVSYNVVVGDTVTKVLIRVTGIAETNIFARRQVVILLATLCITIPLCLYRNIARLAKISFLSLVCVGFILIAIFIRMGTLYSVV